MDDIKAKQQFIDKVKDSTNILVTVSNNPSVDALSAAIGLTLLFDKMGKYATAVFSGTVPPAIAFLEPEKVLDDTTDSLRDFIIALDKEKADHLRYKVEGDSVKIFITPYKTTITSDDLNFSQGDYNVEMVVALGVDDQEHLDGALESHGQILHDATVVTVTAGDHTSTLGGIDWHDDKATSLSEMLAGLAEAFKPEKGKTLIDAEIATAFLTGIVAQTDRFSNVHTTSKAMTVASQLMVAGADQQLIATKLDEAVPTQVDSDEPEPVVAPEQSESTLEADGTLKIEQHEDSEPVTAESIVADEQPAAAVDDLPHIAPFETLEDLDRRVKAHDQAEAAEVATEALEEQVAPAIEEVAVPTPDEPVLGGTLNATTDQAADDARREEESDQNKTLLSHSYLEPSPTPEAPTGGVDTFGNTEQAGSAYILDGQPPVMPAPDPTPVTPPTPVDLGLPMPPPIPDFSQGVPTGPYAAPDQFGAPAPAPVSQPPILGDILAPEPPIAPQPPIEQPQFIDPNSPYAAPPVPPAPTDPGQFKIPGQQ